MFGFGVFVLALLANWVTGNASPRNYQMAVETLQYWYVLWAILVGCVLLVICVSAILGFGFIGAHLSGYVGWLLGLFGGGFISIVVLGAIYTIGWILPVYGTMLLEAGQAPLGIALILVGTIFNTWFTHKLLRN